MKPLLHADVRSYNKAALLDRRVGRLANRVMTFINPKPQKTGVQKTEVQFPFDGTIHRIMASCMTVGSTDTVLQIEKASQADHDADVQLWVPIVQDGITIPAGDFSNASGYAIALPTVDAGDFFRVRLLSLGTGLDGLTVEVTVQS